MESSVINIRYAHDELHETPKEEEIRSDPMVIQHIVSHAYDSNMTVASCVGSSRMNIQTLL